MANTVSILTYDNTFADWVIATNHLIGENNDLAANNYIKSSRSEEHTSELQSH